MLSLVVELDTPKSSPVPLRLTVFGLPALLVIVNVPVRDPEADGENFTVAEHVPPFAAIVVQLLVWVKSPVAATLEIVTAEVVAFVIVMDWPLLVEAST